MSSSPSSRPSVVVAELGPTNTGKTYRAIERMLEHDSGIIGLPLRLLAREVYDRVTAKVGEGRVALMTGEEKRVPPRPDYWICTVEAMPTDREVDFLAVDEIQLAAHRERGHVFTDRLLHARGRKETWFLGADTMRPMVSALIPHVSLKRATRLSQLRYAGRRSLKSLPPRSAVVAFSADRVYELAESLRRLRGGVAVVLGALSPRTRNAQVAMYQSGEVQYLVATDAIGMGLNLDLNHVAFATLSKYDGAEQRDLYPDELAQIAGRAGRHLNDGSFGALNTLPELPPRIVSAIESHRFPAVRSLVWRNSSLDFSSPEALLDSLSRAPRDSAFVRVERADDFDALKGLSAVPAIRELTSDKASVELLWQVCQVPDFRKGLFGQHVALLRETFLQLTAGDGKLDPTWLGRQVSPLDDASGDIHTLMDRLAAIRIWTYISHRPGWLNDAEDWQERTRRIEDALGDALHERLVERFVQRAARRSARRFVRASTQSQSGASDSPFAKLGQLLTEVPGAEGVVMTEEQFVQRVVDATHDAFEVDAAGRISFEAQPLARLVRGRDRRSPQLALAEPEVWTGGARQRLERRLVALARDLVTEAMGGFPAESFTSASRSPATRAVAYQLAEGLGVISQAEAREQWRLLDEESRERLKAQGVHEGQRYLYVTQALSPQALERRAMLTALFQQAACPQGIPQEPALNVSALAGRSARSFGYEIIGPVALRIDIVERLGEGLRGPQGAKQVQALMQQLRLDGGVRAQVLRTLGGQPGGTAQKRRRRRRGRKPSETGGVRGREPAGSSRFNDRP
ncbi:MULTISPECIES: helicase-related protein [unclassified Corallococcus]|uniref:helicase-related protein n=1 Tax=unclassified Corallococcus TaxID=2685029 RepID=UPI001A8DF8A0|nr:MULTISPECIES: helicase-related protein [unclassified Corallococcus]MBN9684849.1 helicase [Corallococcus sp. NCSPR001]WAS83686.1 helicase-related protein [Corallococcus sp. NCRR]